MAKGKSKGKSDSESDWVAKLRGVETFDTEECVVLVRAGVEEAAGALVKHTKAKTWQRDVLGQTVTVTEPSFIVLRLRGHAWSLIAPLMVGSRSALEAPDAKALAKSLKSEAIYFGNSDCASATIYELFDAAGRSGERFQCVEEPEFTSSVRDVEPPEDGPEIYEFVSQFMRERDAFVPPLSIIFDVASGSKRDVELEPEELPSEAIERLDFVAVAPSADSSGKTSPKGKGKSGAKPSQAKRMSKEDRRDAEYTLHGKIALHDLAEVKRLLELGIDANAPNDGGKLAARPLCTAIWHMNPKTLRLSASLAKEIGRPFDIKQIRQDMLEIVRRLLEAGADPDVANGSRTPLSLAADTGDTEVIKLLLNAGANPALAGRYGDTPLAVAKENKRAAIVKLLDAALSKG